MKPALVSGAIVLAFAGYFGYNHVYLQEQQEVSKLREQLTEQQQTQELRSQVALSLEQIERFRKRLPTEPETEWLVREVGRLAEEAGVHLTSIVPQSPKKLEEFTHLAVALQFAASYHRLGKFISILENSPAFLKVEALEVSRVQGATAQVGLTVSTLYSPRLSLLLNSGETGEGQAGLNSTVGAL